MSAVLARPTLGLVAALLGLGLVAAPASAGPRTPDPEQPAARFSPVERRTSAPGADPSLPSSVDSDLYASVLSPTSHTYFLAAGHLTLHLRSGSTTAYTGTFVDYVGNKASKATVDATRADRPELRITGSNGAFRFRLDANFGATFYTGTATRVPSALKVKAGQVSLSATAHKLTSVTQRIVLSERSGPATNPFEYSGTLTMVYDANARIAGGSVTVTDRKGKNVTHSLRSSGYYSAGYFYTVAKLDKTTFGLGATSTGPGSSSGFGFRVGSAKTSQWALTATS